MVAMTAVVIRLRNILFENIGLLLPLIESKSYVWSRWNTATSQKLRGWFRESAAPLARSTTLLSSKVTTQYDKYRPPVKVLLLIRLKIQFVDLKSQKGGALPIGNSFKLLTRIIKIEGARKRSGGGPLIRSSLRRSHLVTAEREPRIRGSRSGYRLSLDVI
jgi:hypothetical protein